MRLMRLPNLIFAQLPRASLHPDGKAFPWGRPVGNPSEEELLPPINDDSITAPLAVRGT
jgi:hypothetical protein